MAAPRRSLCKPSLQQQAIFYHYQRGQKLVHGAQEVLFLVCLLISRLLYPRINKALNCLCMLVHVNSKKQQPLDEANRQPTPDNSCK